MTVYDSFRAEDLTHTQMNEIKSGIDRVLDKMTEGRIWRDPEVLSTASKSVLDPTLAKRFIGAFDGDLGDAQIVHDRLLPGRSITITHGEGNTARTWIETTLRTLRDEALTVKAGYEDIEELDTYDGPILFLSSKIPGGDGHTHQAILIGETHERARIYAAVRMDDVEEARAIRFSEDMDETEYDRMMARFRAQFEDKHAISFAWGRDGFTFVDAGTYPQKMLPGKPVETDDTLTM